MKKDKDNCQAGYSFINTLNPFDLVDDVKLRERNTMYQTAFGALYDANKLFPSMKHSTDKHLTHFFK